MEQFRAEMCGSDARSEAFDGFLRWMADNVPVAGRFFREVMVDIFGQDRLVRDDFVAGHQSVDLGRIHCPLLNVVARYDELVPPRACKPLIQVVGSRDRQTVVFPSTHVGLAAGLAAHEKLWPAIGQWLAARDLPACKGANSAAAQD